MNRRNEISRHVAGVVAFGTAIAIASGTAFAHHPIGGATPDNVLHGFLSGIGHPMIGVDHFAFIVAAGIASAFLASRVILPLLFILATIAGCLIKAALGVTLPFGEFVIALSVVAVGAAVMRGSQPSVSFLAPLFAIAGLFHGSAYADAIVGAEPTPLVAYLAGFAAVQLAFMLVAAYATRVFADKTRDGLLIPVQSRLTGAMVAGVGATFLIENIEQFAFPGM